MTEHLRAKALIDLTALRHNISIIRGLAGDAKVCAVVKADAYGHGIEHIVSAASQVVDEFAVATLDEGIRCRVHAPDCPIMVLSEFSSPDQLSVFSEHRLSPVIHRQCQVDWLVQNKLLTNLCYWLKIDTGMNRLGISPELLVPILEQLKQANHLKRLGFMSHLASADDIKNSQTELQIDFLNQLLNEHAGNRSMANSAGLVNFPNAHFDLVRTGLMLFGVTPVMNHTTDSLNLKPVMQLETRLIAIKAVKKGEKIGYGASWVADKDMRIGIAGFGYADGYPRCIDNRGYVIVNGAQAPVIGRVSMDMMTLDLTSCATVDEGDIVILWGAELPVEKVATWTELIPYELLCQVSPRVPRISIN